MSRRKYATTATSVPRWSATSNVWLNSSCCSRYRHSRATERGSGGPTRRSAAARSRPGRGRGRAPASSAARFGSSPTPKTVSRHAVSTAAAAALAVATRPMQPRILWCYSPASAHPQGYSHKLQDWLWNCGKLFFLQNARFASSPLLRRVSAALWWALHRARSASRSKSLRWVVGGSQKLVGAVDESAAGSVRLLGPPPAAGGGPGFFSPHQLGHRTASLAAPPSPRQGGLASAPCTFARRRSTRASPASSGRCSSSLILWLGSKAVGVAGGPAFIFSALAAFGIFFYIRLLSEEKPR